MLRKLVGGDWNMNGIFSHSVGNGIIIPSDELIFFRGFETTNQKKVEECQNGAGTIEVGVNCR